MGHTGFVDPNEAASVATGYQRRRSPMTPVLRRLLPPGIIGPDRDGYVSFHRFYVGGPAHGGWWAGGRRGPVPADAPARRRADGTRILTAASSVAMRQIRTLGRRFDLGLGWFRPTKQRRTTLAFVQHRGDGGAFATDMRIYPDTGHGW
jgi:hypothetical protein